MNVRRCAVAAALAASVLAAAPAFAQSPPEATGKTPAQAPAKAPPKNYLDEALATGESTGVGYADENEKVEGQKTIAGTKSYQSPLPFFRDLKPWDVNYKPPRTPDGKPDLQGVWSTASLNRVSNAIPLKLSAEPSIGTHHCPRNALASIRSLSGSR